MPMNDSPTKIVRAIVRRGMKLGAIKSHESFPGGRALTLDNGMAAVLKMRKVAEKIRAFNDEKVPDSIRDSLRSRFIERHATAKGLRKWNDVMTSISMAGDKQATQNYAKKKGLKPLPIKD